jgi:hypothetical protein
MFRFSSRCAGVLTVPLDNTACDRNAESRFVHSRHAAYEKQASLATDTGVLSMAGE